MMICRKCGSKYSYRRSPFCSLECSGETSKNKRHGMTDTREHRSWRALHFRCENPKATHFERYGGRGIKVCERWSVFENFLADMGPCPTGCSVDRIDNDKGYEPGNCRWATKAEQNRNKSSVWKPEQIETIRGLLEQGYSVSEVAERIGRTYHAVSAKASQLKIRSKCLPFGAKRRMAQA